MFSESSKSQRDGDRTRCPKALISGKIFYKFDLSFFEELRMKLSK
jgi:hypothetical protein